MYGPAPLTTPSIRPVPGLAHYEPYMWQDSYFRIQDSSEVTFKTYPQPKYRFDAPTGEYATIYANSSDVGTFAEVYRLERAGRLGPAEGERYLVEMVPREPLPLIDLTDERLLSDLDLDDRISTGDRYDICQTWAQTFYQDRPDIYGLRYWPRKAGRRSTNVVLFAERCTSSMSVASAEKLKHIEKTVLAARECYNLVIKFRFE